MRNGKRALKTFMLHKLNPGPNPAAIFQRFWFLCDTVKRAMLLSRQRVKDRYQTNVCFVCISLSLALRRFLSTLRISKMSWHDACTDVVPNKIEWLINKHNVRCLLFRFPVEFWTTFLVATSYRFTIDPAKGSPLSQEQTSHRRLSRSWSLCPGRLSRARIELCCCRELVPWGVAAQKWTLQC